MYMETKKMTETYLQNRNRLTHIENKLMVTKGEKRQGGIKRDIGDVIDIH